MESNISKGVEELEAIINSMDGMEFSLNDSIFSSYVRDLKKWKNRYLSQIQSVIGERPPQPTASNYGNSLAHPQQSEGVGHDCKEFKDSVGKCWMCGEYASAKAEGVGATDSICGDLKDRQAADWDKRSKVVIELSKEVDDVLTFYPAGETTDEALAAIFDKYAPMFQPSEPAALKEFYCIGDKDNLFQCEEQCEDCKKGAAELNKLIEGVDVSYPVRYEDGVVYDAKGWFICELMGGAEREPTEHEDDLGTLIAHALNNLNSENHAISRNSDNLSAPLQPVSAPVDDLSAPVQSNNLQPKKL